MLRDFRCWLARLICPGTSDTERSWRPFRVRDMETGTTVEARKGLHGGLTQMHLTETQQVRITWGKPVNRKGGLAEVEWDPRWESDSDDVTVTQDPTDPYSALVVANHRTDPGTPAVVSIVADADVGEGEELIR